MPGSGDSRQIEAGGRRREAIANAPWCCQSSISPFCIILSSSGLIASAEQPSVVARAAFGSVSGVRILAVSDLAASVFAYQIGLNDRAMTNDRALGAIYYFA